MILLVTPPTPAIPRRLRLSRAPGFTLQLHSMAVNGLPAFNCARPGLLGNPFTPAGESRAMAVHMHRVWLATASASELGYGGTKAAKLDVLRRRVLARVPGMAGHNLACWCELPPEDRRDVCHCTTLLWLANPGVIAEPK